MKNKIRAYAVLLLFSISVNLYADGDSKYWAMELSKLTSEEFRELFLKASKEAGYPKVDQKSGQVEWYNTGILAKPIDLWMDVSSKERFLLISDRTNMAMIIEMAKEKINEKENNLKPEIFSQRHQIQTLYIYTCMNAASNSARMVKNFLKNRFFADTVADIYAACLIGHPFALE